MASKALACSASSATLVSSSSSSGVKALCFSPRSVSFPAKKICPLVSVIRAQNQEDTPADVPDRKFEPLITDKQGRQLLKFVALFNDPMFGPRRWRLSKDEKAPVISFIIGQGEVLAEVQLTITEDDVEFRMKPLKEMAGEESMEEMSAEESAWPEAEDQALRFKLSLKLRLLGEMLSEESGWIDVSDQKLKRKSDLEMWAEMRRRRDVLAEKVELMLKSYKEGKGRADGEVV